MTKKKTTKKYTRTIPRCHFYKLKNANKNRVAKDFLCALKCANKIPELGECLSVLVRAKDENGKWYFSVGIMSLDSLEEGSEIVLSGGAKTVKKLIVSTK